MGTLAVHPLSVTLALTRAGRVSDKDKEARKKAALELSRLAEEGDAAAAEVWLDEGSALLQGLYDAGVINQKSLKAVLGPPRSY